MRNHHLAGIVCILILLFSLSHPGEAKAAAADSTRAQAGARADSVRARAGAQPTLWAQAVHVFELNKKLVPGKTLQKMQELDNDGRVKSETDVEVSLSLDGAGKIKSEIVRASKDGKDITNEQKKKAEEQEKKDAKKNAKGDSNEHSYSVSLKDSPFNPDLQGDVHVAQTNARDTVAGRSCIRFEFSYPEKQQKPSKDKPPLVKGKAWIEEGTGYPVKVESTFDPLPRGVKSMLTTMGYGPEGNGSWILKEMIIEGRGGFLFIKKRFHGDVLFSDYWKYEGPDN